VAAIYIDTTNYINNDNISQVIKNQIGEQTNEERKEKLKEVMGRLKVMKIYEVEDLLLLLAKVISAIKSGELIYPLKMIVIDSLSSLFTNIS
jgi:RecA/RadA recombinase